MVKVLIHYTTNWDEIANIVVPNTKEYCEAHGYLLCVRKVPNYPKYTGVDKLEMINRNLFYGDIGLIIDCDAIITNHAIKVEEFLEEGKDWYMSDGLNAGVFIIRQTPINEKIIDVIIEEIKCGIYHCEQDAFENHSKHIPNFCIKPHPCFNSFIPELYGHISNPEEITAEKGRWEPGQFICHVPSFSIEDRVKVLSELKEQIVR